MTEQIALIFALLIWAIIVTPFLWLTVLSISWRKPAIMFALIFLGTGSIAFLINLIWSK